MVDETGGHETPTRREAMKYAGALVGSGVLAGCGSSSGSDAATTETTTAASETAYTVEMAPVGEVTFEDVPERWETYFPGYAEMGIALGQADGLTAIGNAGRFHTDHLAELDGVSVDKSSVTQLIGDSGIDKELYLELDNDVHLTDPNWLTKNDFFGLDDADIEEIESEAGPFIGNAIFRRTDSWHDYRYYTMYGAFEKVAEVFQQRERYEAFKRLHDEVVADVQARLPPATERPSAVLMFGASNRAEEFSPYRITDKGTNKKHLRDLGIEDALSGTGVEGLSESNRAKIDYEMLLEVDPDLLLVRGHEDKSRAEFRDTVLAFMREHPVASELTAVQNGDVYRGGPIYLGPIYHLFLVERFATTVYPETFSGELFDRERVADIINGEM